MMYKFMEMPDSTEITHSEMREDGSVKVCVERPVEGRSRRPIGNCRPIVALTLKGLA